MKRLMFAAAVVAVFLCPHAALAQGKALSNVATASFAAGTFTQVLPRTDTRTSCVITNVGTTQGYCQAKPTGVVLSTSNSIPVAASGGQFFCSVTGAQVTIQDEIDCNCASGTCAFVINSTGQ